MMRVPALVAAPLALVLVSALAACGGDEAEAGGGTVDVAASFYPLQFLAERVGGDRVSVTGLTPAGAEPHDLELTPDAVAAVTDSDLVIYEKEFQASVDDAVADRDGATLDVSPLATRTFQEGQGDEVGFTDPHFWNDPTKMAAAVGAVADALTEVDPDGATEFEDNATALIGELEDLDAEARSSLEQCRIKTLVTAHDAFGYFAERYGFEVAAISGLSPEDEPTPADLAAVTEIVRDRGVTTVYTETLIPPDLAETVAAETGAATAVLDPIEGISDESPGDDYLAVMKANIETAASGQECG